MKTLPVLDRVVGSGLLKQAQTIAERLSRRVVIRRRLPEAFGRDEIYVSPGAMLKLWRPDLGAVDPDLFSWAASFVHPQDVVWDIGANVGLFAFAAAHRAGAAGHVLAVEADIWLAGLLRRSARQLSQDSARVEVLPAAVSESVSVARFNIAARGRAANFLEGVGGSSQSGGVREVQSVVAVTLDWLLDYFPAPNLIKIDVEGAEHLVLSGGQRLLSLFQPLILCEVRASTAPSVTGLLQEHGYKLYDLNRDCQPVQAAVFNTLARPARPGIEPGAIERS